MSESRRHVSTAIGCVVIVVGNGAAGRLILDLRKYADKSSVHISGDNGPLEMGKTWNTHHTQSRMVFKTFMKSVEMSFQVAEIETETESQS